MMDTASCLFPKGVLNGQCVACPVDTLYEYVHLIVYMYQVRSKYYSRLTRVDKSHHKCVNICSPNTPIIRSNRLCSSSCSSMIYQQGEIKYCKDGEINDGLCNIEKCHSGYKCFYMQCFKVCPTYTVDYNGSCVIECLEDQLFVFRGKCVRECPKNYVNETGICQTSCSKGRYLHHNTCIDTCPKTQPYMNEQKCVTKCTVQKIIQ